jgi:6-phosphogluconolactonase
VYMRFLLESQDLAVQALTARLNHELEAKHVLWLVSGGSNIEAAVRVMANLPEELTSKLTIMPVDERYGEVNHADSNWQQLMQAGLDAKQAQTLSVLADLSFDETLKRYETLASKAFEQADFVVSQLGVGADGHIAGILPGSPAVEASGLVAGYTSQPYQRLTLTFEALKRVNVAYVLAYGESKKPTLTDLMSGHLSLDIQPAQFLRSLGEVYLYNDQIGGNQ